MDFWAVYAVFTTVLIASYSAPSLAQNRGNVSGELIYPGEGLPPQVVCAVPVDGGNRLCTRVREGQDRFNMQVPVGRYYFSSEHGSLKAWYSTYDGAHVDYSVAPVSARIVNITSLSPDSVWGICVCDWYNTKNISFPR